MAIERKKDREFVGIDKAYAVGYRLRRHYLKEKKTFFRKSINTSIKHKQQTKAITPDIA